jgi:hypothetical protein
MNDEVEVCKTCNGTGIEYDGAGHTCTACNGIAAPVVERQPVAWIDPISLKHSDNEKQWVRIAGSLAENRVNGYTLALYTAPPELAELQAPTNGALIKDLTEVIAQQAAEIERLKGGQGEPVAWCNKANLEALKEKGYCQIWLGKMTSMDEPIGIYTSQPAPVSVVLPTMLSSEDGPHYSGDRGPELGYLAGYKACLDKVKELNQ